MAKRFLLCKKMFSIVKFVFKCLHIQLCCHVSIHTALNALLKVAGTDRHWLLASNHSILTRSVANIYGSHVVTKTASEFIFSKKYADEIDCPECRQPAPFPKGSIIYLPFNRMMGKMLEDNGSSDHVLTKSDLNIILKSVCIIICSLTWHKYRDRIWLITEPHYETVQSKIRSCLGKATMSAK